MLDNKCNELISILMPTYNVEKFVEKAVISIINQTYKNFELIIVDDCSTDRTYEILEKLAMGNNRIKLFRNDTNSKICKTLNKAFYYARGKYIGRMDGDDISTPERFEILKRFLDEHSDISLVGSNMITIDETGKEISRKQYIKTNKYIKFGNKYQPCVAHIWLARREVYDALKGYRDVPYVEDWDFLLRGQNRGFNYANVDKFIYKCRLRNGNTGTTNGLQQRKAGKYILNLNINEKKGKNKFNKSEYFNAIRYSKKEQEEYVKALQDLNIAIHSKDNKYKLILYTVRSIVESKYIARYILESIMVRMIFKIERIKMHLE